MQSQGLLFSEPSIAETGVWCELADGIDPAKWARICKHIGNLSPNEFEQVSSILISEPIKAENSVFAGIKRLIHFGSDKSCSLPIVSISPGKPGDAFQWEI